MTSNFRGGWNLSSATRATRRTLVSLGSAVVFGLVAGMLGPVAHAQTPSATVLTLTGNVSAAGKAGTVAFDMAALKALKQQTFTTSTPWDARPVKFTGPLLRDVLAAASAKGVQLSAVAVNDYAVTVPMEDATKFDPILAVQIDGRDIPPRTRGPVFLIYPFSSLPELNTPTYHARAIWQLKAIKVQ